jgi:membrane protein implicated in regulation of membrane protease activity
MSIWFWIWLIVAASLFVTEMLTVTFFVLPFAIGATTAMIVSLFNWGVGWQWVVFLVVSVLALAVCRPLANRLTRGSTTKSGVDRLIGLDAVIMDQAAPSGMRRAKVDGELWNVMLEPGLEGYTSEIAIGERVYIMGVEGTRLIVRRYQ